MNQKNDDAILRLENLWKGAEQRVMEDVVRRIEKNGKITSTADYQINRFIEMGKSTEKVENIIKESLNATYPEMFELYDNVAQQEYVRNKNIYEQINGYALSDEENRWKSRVSEAIKEQTKQTLENLSQSHGFSVMMGNKRVYMPFATYYQNYVDSAIMDILTGGFDYNTVIRRTVTQMVSSGLRTVEYYDTGHSNRVDVAVRRAIMTGVNQITQQISRRNAAQLGTAYYEVSWHNGARPSHAVWQGRVYKEEELESVCGLGDVTGLCGANCRHSYYPFVPGVSKRTYSDEWLQEQNEKEAQTKEWKAKQLNVYDQTQQQRKMETAMRAQREKVKLLEEGKASKDEIMLAKCKYQAQLDEYKQFSKKMGLPEQRERIYYDMRGRVAPGKSSKQAVEKKLERMYNKGNFSDNLKIYEQDIRIKNRIREGKIPTNIEMGKQGKHIKGHNNYIPGRSYLSISELEIKKIIEKYAGNGQIKRDSKGRWTNKEFVTADKKIGVVVDPVTRREKGTARFSIHYSKKGVHIVPREEE